MYPFKKKYRISQNYGLAHSSVAHYYPDGIHYGIDYASPCGTDLYSVTPGVVSKVKFSDNSYGNQIWTETIIDGINVKILYGHLESIHVSQGQQVLAGQFIGRTGTTGLSTACHLHLAAQENNRWVNPQKYVDMDFSSHDILKQINMTLEELKNELKKDFVEKDIRFNVDMKDGSVWIVNHNKKYKIGTHPEKDIAVISHKIAKEQLSDAERGYAQTDNINEVLS